MIYIPIKEMKREKGMAAANFIPGFLEIMEDNFENVFRWKPRQQGSRE